MPNIYLSQKTLIATFAFFTYFTITGTAFADIYLSKEQAPDTPSNKPVQTFQCTDKIYGVVTGQWPAGSEHLLEAYWTDPKGKQREHTRYKFKALNGETRTWAWLILHRAEPDILERLMMQEDDSLREFNGRWKVDFYIDGKISGKLTFQVTCG